MRWWGAVMLVAACSSSADAPMDAAVDAWPPIEGQTSTVHFTPWPRHALAIGTSNDYQLLGGSDYHPLDIVASHLEDPELVDLDQQPRHVRLTGKAVGDARIWLSARPTSDLYRGRLVVPVIEPGTFQFWDCPAAVANRPAHVRFRFIEATGGSGRYAQGRGRLPLTIEPAGAATLDLALSTDTHFQLDIGTTPFTMRSDLSQIANTSFSTVAIVNPSDITGVVAVKEDLTNSRDRIYLYGRLADGTVTCTRVPARVTRTGLSSCDFEDPVTGAEISAVDAPDGVFVAFTCPTADVQPLAPYDHLPEASVDLGAGAGWPGGGGGGGGVDWD